MAANVYDAVKSRLEVLLAGQEDPGIERSAVRQEEQDRAGRLLSDTAAAHRRRREDASRSLFPDSDEPSNSRSRMADWSDVNLENHFLAKAIGVGGLIPLPNVPLPILPPFNFQRAEGNGILNDALNTGRCLTVPTDNGLALAGVGFQVSPSAEKDASINPLGSYEFNVFCLGGAPAARSQGGLSAAVYADGDPNPVAERHATLWNLVGVPQFFGQAGNGALRDAATPPSPGSFGTVPLSPLEVRFHAGHSYVFWYWCWQQNNGILDTGLFATLNMTLEGALIHRYPPGAGPH